MKVVVRKESVISDWDSGRRPKIVAKDNAKGMRK